LNFTTLHHEILFIISRARNFFLLYKVSITTKKNRYQRYRVKRSCVKYRLRERRSLSCLAYPISSENRHDIEMFS